MIDFTKYEKAIESQIKEWIDKATEYLLDKVKENSPEDTGDYIAWHKIEKAQSNWNTIKWSVYNDMKYAEEVEYWFRSTPVNWHKNRKQWWPVIYRWVWARTYSRTSDNEEQNIKNIINKSIKWI
jgi:hypothetical protein